MLRRYFAASARRIARASHPVYICRMIRRARLFVSNARFRRRIRALRTNRRALGSVEAVLEREDDQLHTVAQREFGEDAADVGLHGRLAEILAGGDLGVRQPAGGERED